MTWPGHDYVNLDYMPGGYPRNPTKLAHFQDEMDRDKHPRMPWHGLQIL